jgi:hypothetical protein
LIAFILLALQAIAQAVLGLLSIMKSYERAQIERALDSVFNLHFGYPSGGPLLESKELRRR